MAVMAYAQRQDIDYVPHSSSLGDYFSKQITKIARLLVQERELKAEMLAKGRDLADALIVIADNPTIPLSDKAIELTRKNLSWMEAYLDGEDQGFLLDGLQFKELKTIYQDIAKSLSLIVIQMADSGN